MDGADRSKHFQRGIKTGWLVTDSGFAICPQCLKFESKEDNQRTITPIDN